MTGRTGLAVSRDGANNGTLPQGHRLALGGLLSKQTTGIDVRKGVMFDGGGAVVTGQASMNYAIRAHVAVAMPSATQGPILVPNDAQVLVATAASPGANSRIDSIWVRQHLVAADGGADLDVITEYGVTNGLVAAVPVAPAPPAGAVELARATVTALAANTNALVITQTHPWCAAAGAPIPVRDDAERALLTAYDGLLVNHLGDRLLQRYNSASAAWDPSWRSYVPVVVGTAAPTLDCRYIRNGKDITVEIDLTLTAAITADLTISLPSNAANKLRSNLGGLGMYDMSSGNERHAYARLGTVNTFQTAFEPAGGIVDYAGNGVPWAWAAGDTISGVIEYREA